jgi:hypothetical protein
MFKPKPCHCGSEDVRVSKKKFPGSQHVLCNACGMQTGFYSTANHAIKAWNYRPREAELLIELRAARKVIMELQS